VRVAIGFFKILCIYKKIKAKNVMFLCVESEFFRKSEFLVEKVT